MKLLDRRFLNISLTVLGVHNSPEANPATGTQYIVGSNPSGAFASASPNQIARFNGTTWSFTTPKAGELEVLNLDTGEILSFNGTEWNSAISLSGNYQASFFLIDGIASYYEQSFDDDNYLTAGNKVLSLESGYPTCNFAVDGDNHSIFWASFFVNKGASYLSMPFTDSDVEHPYQIYVAGNNSWQIQDVPEGAIFFNRSNSCLYSIINREIVKISDKILVFNHFVTTGYDEPNENTQGEFFLDLSSIRTNEEEGPALYVKNNGAWDYSYFYQYNSEIFVSTTHGCVLQWIDSSESDKRAFLTYQLNGGDLLFDNANNLLYRYDYYNNTFIPLNAGSSQSDSSAYEPIPPVLAIIPSGATLPATAATGDAFLNTSDAKLYTATATNTWDSGTITANGSRYASSTDHKIYVSDGTALTASNILNGDLFLNKEDNSVYAYDSAVPAFVKVGGSSITFFTEHHSLTAGEVTNKRFSLTHNIAVGQESNTLLFVSGIAQTVGVDFSASGNSISWNNKALDDIALTAGDSFLVQYIRG